MRKISVLLATLGLVAAGVLFPASAQASAACDTAWRGTQSGYFRAYNYVNCSGYMGSANGNDSSWGDSAGGFRGSDGNAAHSLVHKGTSGMAVKVYTGVSYSGNWGCIKQSEFYVSSLSGDRLTGGPGSYNAWDSISSHKWVWNGDCGTSFLH
jgi:hypothetical protein